MARKYSSHSAGAFRFVDRLLSRAGAFNSMDRTPKTQATQAKADERTPSNSSFLRPQAPAEPRGPAWLALRLRRACPRTKGRGRSGLPTPRSCVLSGAPPSAILMAERDGNMVPTRLLNKHAKAGPVGLARPSDGMDEPEDPSCPGAATRSAQGG